MSGEDIKRELEKKKKILRWAIKNNLRNFSQIGKIMILYYTNPQLLEETIRKNDIKEIQ